MSKHAENLPDDPAVLKEMIAALQAENAKISATLRVHDQLVQALRLRIAKLQKLAFGKSSEKIEREIEREIEQLELALEDLLVAVAEEDDAPIDEGQDEPSPEKSAAPALRRRPRVSNETLRERRELDPGTCCPDCGGDLRVVGEDVSELLDMIAAQMKVVQIARIKKSCRRCEKMVQEPAPSRPIPGSMAGPNLLAHVLVSKFDDHLPLYRQHEIFERMGADIPESTLVGWCGRAMKSLSPLIERIEVDIMGSDLLHAPSRQIASQSPAGRWTTHPSGYWTAQCATRVWAKGSDKAGSGFTYAINVLGPVHHHLVLSIGSHRTGRKSMFLIIWPMPAAFCKPPLMVCKQTTAGQWTATRAMPNFTRRVLMARDVCGGGLSGTPAARLP